MWDGVKVTPGHLYVISPHSSIQVGRIGGLFWLGLCAMGLSHLDSSGYFLALTYLTAPHLSASHHHVL